VTSETFRWFLGEKGGGGGRVRELRGQRFVLDRVCNQGGGTSDHKDAKRSQKKKSKGVICKRVDGKRETVGDQNKTRPDQGATVEKLPDRNQKNPQTSRNYRKGRTLSEMGPA